MERRLTGRICGVRVCRKIVIKTDILLINHDEVFDGSEGSIV